MAEPTPFLNTQPVQYSGELCFSPQPSRKLDLKGCKPTLEAVRASFQKGFFRAKKADERGKRTFTTIKVKNPACRQLGNGNPSSDQKITFSSTKAYGNVLPCAWDEENKRGTICPSDKSLFYVYGTPLGRRPGNLHFWKAGDNNTLSFKSQFLEELSYPDSFYSHLFPVYLKKEQCFALISRNTGEAEVFVVDLEKNQKVAEENQKGQRVEFFPKSNNDVEIKSPSSVIKVGRQYFYTKLRTTNKDFLLEEISFRKTKPSCIVLSSAFELSTKQAERHPRTLTTTIYGQQPLFATFFANASLPTKVEFFSEKGKEMGILEIPKPDNQQQYRLSLGDLRLDAKGQPFFSAWLQPVVKQKGQKPPPKWIQQNYSIAVTHDKTYSDQLHADPKAMIEWLKLFPSST